MSRERNLARELDDLLRLLDVPVRIGLRQQGHLPTVKRMLAEGKTWDEIGDAIGWDPKAAQRWYRIETEGPIDRCLAHLEDEPCPTCAAYKAAGL